MVSDYFAPFFNFETLPAIPAVYKDKNVREKQF